MKGDIRYVINQANGTVNVADVIWFDIQDAGPPPIKLSAPLTIGDPLTILGYTQPGAFPNSLATGNNAVLKIQLRPDGAQWGIEIQTRDTTIEGLDVAEFPTDGIRIQGGAGLTNNTIRGNFIHDNIHDGIFLWNGANSNLIGGTTPASRNTISGNHRNGIWLQASNFNRIENNYIGTNPGGAADQGNWHSGVRLTNGSRENTVGGTVDTARNVISGNTQKGVRIEGAESVDNLVQRNYIGVDVTGAVRLANDQEGVYISNASRTIIGGYVTDDPSKVHRNIISGNGRHGVLITGAQATANKILGNYIGTDAGGNVRIENNLGGVKIDGSHGNFVGQGSPAVGNIISGNGAAGQTTAHGIELLNSNNTTVENNRVGLSLGGAALGNRGDGIAVTGG